MGKIIVNKGLNWNSINKLYYGLKAESNENIFISSSYHNTQRGLKYYSTEKIRYYGILSSLEGRTKYKDFITNFRLVQKLNRVMPHIFK